MRCSRLLWLLLLLLLPDSQSASAQQTGHWNHAFRTTGSQAFKHYSPQHSVGWSVCAPGMNPGFSAAFANSGWQSGWGNFGYNWQFGWGGYGYSWQSASTTTWIHTLPFSGQRVTISTLAPGLCHVAPLLAPARSGLYTTDPCTGLLIPLEWWYYGCLPGFSVCPRPWGLFSVPIVYSRSTVPAQIAASPGWASQDSSVPDPLILNRLLAQARADNEASAARKLPTPEEFPAAEAVQRQVTAAERIDSLRLISQGDDAFRRADYATAATSYHAALRLSPDQPAAWLREVHLNIVQGRFERAAACLKTSLTLTGAAESLRLTAGAIYGSDDAPELQKSSQRLWQWLTERPESADRLLLMAAFELLQSHDTVSSELITQAELQGGSAICTAVLRQQLAQAQPVSNFVQNEAAEIADNANIVADPATTPKPAAEDSTGIVLKGRRQKKL